ncbi:DNA adenine methylase [Halosquirtibacter xylanolyticus]|uniref:DNA adenine methylase n=1 Tax=Halosquirtibacter xylanolyticus TaxID=3374599 RepID=UPI00374A0A2D|nr:DNA adenine methylase [Prolixibacteraceae bacterium]
MKPPITYYGGKQKLVKHLLPLVPEHNLYAEPFFGGGALFWAKEPSNVEVINDCDRELINFYEVMKRDFEALKGMMDASLHSRTSHNDAQVILKNPHLFTSVQRAWSIWVLSSQSFSSMLDGAWGYDVKKASTSTKVHNQKLRFQSVYQERLSRVQIESTDAIRIIKSRDRVDSFFYCDPPYYNSDCGHYDGYTLEDYTLLLETLSNIQGKFILSSYPSPILDNFTKEKGWYQKEFIQRVSVNNCSRKKDKNKREVITANFEII